MKIGVTTRTFVPAATPWAQLQLQQAKWKVFNAQCYLQLRASAHQLEF